MTSFLRFFLSRDLGKRPESANQSANPSTFYEPPSKPSDPLQSLGAEANIKLDAVGNSGHDPFTDGIHLTTAFPTSSTTFPVDDTLLPPVVNDAGSGNGPVPTATVPKPAQTPVKDQSVFKCSEKSSGMTTNFVNPKYPEDDSNKDLETNERCTFLLEMNSDDICQVRVDFVASRMLRPTKGRCLRQNLELRGTIWPLGVESFCGINFDQHFYVEIDQSIKAQRFVEFIVTTRAKISLGLEFEESVFNWGLWITQLPCDGSRYLTAPMGCFQYFLESAGVLKSYNYDGGSYLNNQVYYIFSSNSH